MSHAVTVSVSSKCCIEGVGPSGTDTFCTPSTGILSTTGLSFLLRSAEKPAAEG